MGISFAKGIFGVAATAPVAVKDRRRLAVDKDNRAAGLIRKGPA